MSDWADKASQVMTETLIQCRAEKLTPEQTATAIDGAYPFGDRSNSPYKVWLRQRKEFFAKHGLPRKTSQKETGPQQALW